MHWYHEGKLFRESAHTRSWSNAQQKARAVELKFDHIELGKPPQKHEPVTIEKAVTHYLADKKSQQLADPTLEKLETIFRKQMLLS